MPHLNQIVGLDLGARHARAVWVQLRGGAPHIVRAEQMALPLEGGDAPALLRSWLGQLGLLKKFAAVQIPGTQLVFQPGRLNPEDPRTPRQAAEMELSTFNDMAGDTMASDVASHEWSPGVRIYVMGMARPAVIAEALAGLEPVGIRPADLVPAPVALFNALAPLAPDLSGAGLFVNIGHNQTELAIGTARGLLFARAFPMGGRQFTEAVARLAGVPLTQADKQKQREGTIEPGGPFAEALRPLAERWYSQLAACLSAYRGAFTGGQFGIARVVLSGGGAQLRGLRDYVQERTGLPVGLADELPGAAALAWGAGAGRAAGADPRDARPALGHFDLALGLARTALESGPATLSLLPEPLRGEVVFREKKPYLIAASVMGALTLGVVTASMVVSLSGETGKLDEERRELRRREQMDKSIAAIRQRGELLRQRGGPLRKLLLGGPVMREVISLVANAISPDDWISMICEETSYTRQPKAGEKPAAPAPAPRAGFFVPGFRSVARSAASRPATEAGSLLAGLTPPPPPSDFTVFIIEGYTPDMGLTTVKAMIQRLKTAARVRQVDLLSDDRVLPPTLPEALRDQGVELPNMRRFVVRLEVGLP
ncbi:MAG: pilus assembly protein PilM [Lentisphaerae bacterium]|nr:pilus assembly protein PilM [Lentisphaerota bacterium]